MCIRCSAYLGLASTLAAAGDRGTAIAVGLTHSPRVMAFTPAAGHAAAAL